MDWLRRNQRNISKTSCEFNIDRKRVREWDQKYDFLKQHNKGSSAKRRKLYCGRTPLSADLDTKVLEFLEEQRSHGRPVSNRVLLQQAGHIAGGLGISDFKSSRGWLCRWKARHNIGMRRGTNTAQKVPADFADKLLDLRERIITIRKANDIGPSGIINMDQTMCRFDMPPSYTNSVRGSKTIRIKTTRAEKKGFTIALAATAAGEKLPAVVIFKERGGVLGDRVRRGLRVPSNVQVKSLASIL